MENNSKLIAYTAWADRIKNASNEEFFPLLREFFSLLENENQKKAEVLEKEARDKYKRLDDLAKAAFEELKSLLKEIEEEAQKENINSLPEIDEWRKNQVMFSSPFISDKVEALEDAIRHTLENLRNSGKFKDFKNNLFGSRREVNSRTGEESEFYYISYSKFCEVYPAFRRYKEYSAQLIREDKKEILPYAAYMIIKKWSDENHRRDVGLVDLGERMRSRIITALNVLVLYFLKEDDESETLLEEPEWRENFRFYSNVLSLPPFGECKFEKTGGKINRRAFLVKLVFSGGMKGISALLIKKSFREKGMREPDNREIDAMIVQINKRFKKCFKGADVFLQNIGSKGVKVIRLSVCPRS